MSAPSAPLTGAPAEEIWIVGRTSAPSTMHDDRHEYGLFGRCATDDPPAALPLLETNVNARIDSWIASVTVEQRFSNPYRTPFDARYVFPLPDDAGISDFIMTIGTRRIRGIVRERAEAQAIYENARARGLNASLLTQHRPNVFSQDVANLQPAQDIDVSITYFNTLDQRDGWFEFVFPMTIGPRFMSSDGSNTPGHHLPALTRAADTIAIDVAIHGHDVTDVQSPSHDIVLSHQSHERVALALAAHERRPDRDFVLRYRIGSGNLRSELLADADATGGHVALLLQPPSELARIPRAPIEMIFVLDCSGSMKGTPLQQSQRAVEYALSQLRPDDSFQIVRFSNSSSTLGSRALPATPANVERGRCYVRDLSSGGGTMMRRGLETALDFPFDRAGRQRYVVLMTDGFIGEEDDVLATITPRLGSARIFSFGIGDRPNRFLMDRLAALGRGAVSYLGDQDDAVAVMQEFVGTIAHPALTHLDLAWHGAGVTDVSPRQLPDLFAGRPVVITARYSGPTPPSVTVSGYVGGTRLESTRDARPAPDAATHGRSALPVLWARHTIDDLEARARHEPHVRPRITQLALQYGIVSQGTSYIAVDAVAPTRYHPAADEWRESDAAGSRVIRRHEHRALRTP